MDARGSPEEFWELDPATGQYTREWVDIGGTRELMVMGVGGKKRNESGPVLLIQSPTGYGYVDAVGNVYDFGSPTGTQLQTVTDVFGNETKYEYDASYPDQLVAISYDKFVGAFGADYATRVQLIYLGLPAGVTLDIDVSTGTALRRNTKLDYVVVKNHKGDTLHHWASTIQYKLEYATRGQRLLLSKVTKQGADPWGAVGAFNVAEAPTEFTYETSNEYSIAPGTGIGVTSLAGNAEIEWVDLDGDGRPDLLWSSGSTQYWARNVTTSASAVVTFASAQVVPGGWVVTTHAWMDFDGDGVADRLEVGTPTCGAGILSIRRGQKTINTDGTVVLSYASPTCVSMTPGAPNMYFGITRTDSYGRVIGKLVDVNGDGVLDWLEPWSTNQTTGGWRVYHGYRTATGWAFGTPLQRQLSGYDFTGGAPPLSGGQGLTVPPGYVPGVAPTQFKSADLYSAIDVNGDGIPDFAQAVATGGGPTRWAVWYLTRSGFSSVGAGDLGLHGLLHWLRPFQRTVDHGPAESERSGGGVRPQHLGGLRGIRWKGREPVHRDGARCRR